MPSRSRARELARLAGRGLYNTADFAARDVAPFLLTVAGGGIGLAAGGMATAGAMLGGGRGMAVADTVMRDRDRPVDEETTRMEDTAHAEGLLARPALRSFQATNGGRRIDRGATQSATSATSATTADGAARGGWRRGWATAATDGLRNVMPYVMPYPYNR